MAIAPPATAASSRNDGIRTTSLPPRRGQIKARIFGSMVKAASSAALKAGALLGIHKASGASSASEDSPPSSTYDSNGKPNIP